MTLEPPASTPTPPPSAPADGGRVRLLVADDHDPYRWGMRVVMEFNPALEIVGEAANGREAVELACELAPDVVLMDVRMPIVGGIDACRAIRVRVPSAKIVMLTMSDDEVDLLEAIKAGACGYLLKELPAEDVSEAVIRVHAGDSLIPARLAATILRELTRLSDKSPNEGEGALSGRERGVLQMLAQGRSTAGAARDLGISEDAVRSDLRRILRTLQSLAGPGAASGAEGLRHRTRG